MRFDFEDLGITALIRDQGKRSTKIYFGYPASNPYSEVAKSLAFGTGGPLTYTSPRGNVIHLKSIWPARPFLTDGFNYCIPFLNDEIEKYWKDFVERGVSSTDKLGQLIVDSIKAFVEYGDPYTNEKPNSPQVEEDKGNPSVPLIDSGGMIDAMEFVVTKAINKNVNIKRR